jgi:hypothetical protein
MFAAQLTYIDQLAALAIDVAALTAAINAAAELGGFDIEIPVPGLVCSLT